MCLTPIRLSPNIHGGVLVPCGKCIECLQQKSMEWAFRCMLESMQYDYNCLITLTYAESPDELNKRDYQLFLKRLRKRLEPLKIRYFGCGEYGSLNGRPHYHFIIFGWRPDDLKLLYTKNGERYYKSDFLQSIWGFGIVNITDLTLDSAKYVAKYLQKMIFKDDNKTKPFISMSTHPGIGFNAINAADLLDDRIIIRGRSIRIPRYFLKVLERDGGEDLSDLKERRARIKYLFSFGDNDLRRQERIDKYLKKFGRIK